MRGEGSPGRAEWIERTLERFEGPLLAYARRLVRDPHRAQDVVQDVFLSLCAQDRAEVETRLAPWLFAVARNRALNEIRADRRRVPEGSARPPPAGPASDLASRIDASDAAARVLRALEQVPEPQQEAVRLKLQHGLAYRDIAEVMRVTTGHVAVLVHRGLGSLRASLRAATPARAPAAEGRA